MGDTSCSCYPERLKAYGALGQRDDGDLSTSGRSLSTALQALANSHPDPTILPRFEDWGGDLRRYATRKAQIDQWVGDVGRAFEQAAGGSFDANTFVVTDASNVDRWLAADDPAVRNAVTFAHGMLDNSFLASMDLLPALNQMLQGMTPEQIQEFLWGLGPDDLSRLGIHIVNLPMGMGTSLGDRNTFLNIILPSVDLDTLQRLVRTMPELEPDFQTHYLGHDYKGYQWSWQATGDPLWGPNGVPDPLVDINQGDDGDCWFLAGLGSVAMANPELLQQHIRQNPNGTFTVTFYRNGRPVEITVTNDMPTGTSNGWTLTPYAHTGSDNAQWVMVYEKAYAEFRGGYANIDGGFGDTSIGDLTGQPTTRTGPGDTSLAQLQQKLSQGYAITTGSNSDDNPWWDFWDHPERMDGNKVVTSHEYMVQSVNTSAHPPTVTLVNPWGASGGAPHLITLTEDEWHHYFGEVSMGRVGP